MCVYLTDVCLDACVGRLYDVTGQLDVAVDGQGFVGAVSVDAHPPL